MNQTSKVKTKCKSLTTVRSLLYQMEHPKPKILPQNKQVFVDIQQVRKNMKNKWKDPGHCNIQFSNFKALKGRLLNQWQIQRIFLSKRSYQNPKNAKKYKFTIQSRQFPKLSKQSCSLKFQKYLQDMQKTNQDNFLNTKNTKFATQMSGLQTYIKQHKYSKPQFQKYATTNKSFGLGTVVWHKKNYQAGRKLKTINI